jgi:hypothetical protein
MGRARHKDLGGLVITGFTSRSCAVQEHCRVWDTSSGVSDSCSVADSTPGPDIFGPLILDICDGVVSGVFQLPEGPTQFVQFGSPSNA